jgi:uncharacterized protein YjiS (DUF1127 family)
MLAPGRRSRFTINPFASSSAPSRRAWLLFRTRRALRAATAELMALDDHALKDIGLDHSEIEPALVNRARERRNGASLRLVPKCRKQGRAAGLDNGSAVDKLPHLRNQPKVSRRSRGLASRTVLTGRN